MARYFPEPVPYTDDLPYIREWLGREFSNVLVAFEEVENVQLEETHIAPTSPREGMIRLADGTDWNPGQGSGFYGYRDGAWFKLDLDSTDTAELTYLDIVRAAAPDSQFLRLGPSDAGGHQIWGFSATNNAKPFIFNSTTDSGNTAPSGGENGYSFQIRGVEKLRIDDSSDTIDVKTLMDLQSGQIKFPATQAASSDVNTLDDYEEGTWTPDLTFATPGDLSIAYSTRNAAYVKIGQLVYVKIVVVTSTFTHTTASGELRITGLPFVHLNAGSEGTGSCEQSNITYAGTHTQINANMPVNQTYMRFVTSGTGSGRGAVGSGQALSGTQKTLIITAMYRTNS